jgi:predicted metal-dependent hydrolase
MPTGCPQGPVGEGHPPVGCQIVGGWSYGCRVAEPLVEVRRSKRRTRTVTAYREGETLVVLLPARMTKKEEAHWVAEMQRRLLRSESRRRPPGRTSDSALLARCAELSERHMDGLAVPSSVRWVPPMRTRWASCTPVDRSIRISERLREVPSWVLDYVLVHELAHLLVPGHDQEFWELVQRYPRAERAIGYLEGLASAAGSGPMDD